VTPQISEGDTVRLEIVQSLSEVAAQAQLSGSQDIGPTLIKREVENTVYVRDGEAVMIGGIITERMLETETKVPFLGDIPILGWAFKSTSESISKVNLLIILTPHIVRDPEDLRRLTVEAREEFRANSGDSLLRSEEQQEARRRALAAGLDLPRESNPVLREMEAHQRRYPVEMLPGLRQQQKAQEEQRRLDLEKSQRRQGGAYLVQVSTFREATEAVDLLQELIAEGYDGTLLSRRDREELYHFVQLGPYLTEDRAQQVAREVGVATGLETVVIIEH
jgi:hypothetical protein